MSLISHSFDQVQLVDFYDQPLAVMDKVEAHRGEGKLHRAISVFLTRRYQGQRQFLFQQRSAKKIVGALEWANTCCGNVLPGESYEQCAIRRLRDELGIELTEADLQPFATLRYQVQCNQQFSEREVDRLFWAEYDGPIEPNPAEVHTFEWIAIESIQPREDGTKKWSPWFEIMNQQSILHDLAWICD